MKCGACQKVCRKTCLAWVANAAAGLVRARVCVSCFRGAIHVVAAVTSSPPPTVNEVKRDRRDAADAVKGAVRKLKNMLKAYHGKHPDQLGLEQAIDVLEAGDF